MVLPSGEDSAERKEGKQHIALNEREKGDKYRYERGGMINRAHILNRER